MTQPLALTGDLLKLLYGGPLETVPWRDFLSALVDTIGCENAAITLQLSRKGLAPMVVWGKPTPVGGELARDIGDRHAAIGHLDPLRNALQRSGDIALLEEVTSRAVLEESEFYRTVMQPYGIEQALGMYVTEPGGLECNIGLVSGGDGLRFDDTHKKFIAELRPHFEQALTLFSRIYRDESELEVLTDALDRLTIGTFIIDGRGRMVRANGAARRMIDRGDTFRLVEGRLTLSGRTDAIRFREMVEHALSVRMGDGDSDFVKAFRCADNDADGLGILVRVIRREKLTPSDIGPAVVVYATEAGQSGSFERLIATLFDLSPSEANLAALLSQGMTLAEAARETGLTESTVRTYSKKIFAKVGVGRQAELVRLILRSVAMLG